MRDDDAEPRMEKRPRFAVLVDGDNAQSSLLKPMQEEVVKYGIPTVKRVYGDWTRPEMQGWKRALHELAFQPMQQFNYVSGKNSTDAALIIDAMDILYSENVDAFCIVSSDSDYTRLATRFREEGKFVMGIGEKKTPKSLVNACNVFVYTENLAESGSDGSKGGGGGGGQPRRKASKQEEQEMRNLLTRAFDNVEEEDGWAPLSRVGDQLRQLDSGFDPRTYGKQKLMDLILDQKDLFESRREKRKGQHTVYIRRKDTPV